MKKISEETNKNITAEPKYFMREISKTLFLTDIFIESSNNISTKNEFLKDYQYKIINIIKDIIYTILTPFRLWLISNNVNNIVNFINANIGDNDIHSCKLAEFNDDIFSNILTDEFENNKTYKSLAYFNELYPSWYNYMIHKINGRTNEIKINVI